MLSINMDDVWQVVSNIQNYLIAFAVVLVLAIIVMIAVRKLPKSKKGLIRAESGIAILLALAAVANLICTGPMSTLLDLVSGDGTISEETSAEATELVNEITEEGVVLAENDDILPLASGSKLNVFGWASTSPCYGGTGSGALNESYPTTDLLTGLNNAGIETNTELTQFYTDYCSVRPTVGMGTQDWTLPEPNVSQYSDELIANAKSFSDTAMIVITRVGGEGADLPTDMASVVDGSYIRRVNEESGRGAGYYMGTYDDTLNEGNDWDEGDHFLQLDNREEELVDLVTSNFDNVIVVYNGANAFEMGWVNDYPQIKGVVLCPGTGQSGFAGFGRVIAGEVNPSGRTVDTYVADLTKAPWWNNFGDFKYTNTSEFDAEGNWFDPAGPSPSFVNYVENIYVGYKFYETAAVEGLIEYDDEVVYPFGYGLSYTEFTQEMSDLTEDGSNLKFTVTVTNTGDVAGKDVVEIYYNPPYKDGLIEKSSANLIDFAKTDELAPGESQEIEFTIAIEDMASYDTLQGDGCYILDAGDYIISANSDSHNVLDSQTYTVAETISYEGENGRESDETTATNQFEFAEGDVTYLSRAGGFANYEEATAAPAADAYEMSDDVKAVFDNAVTYTTEGYKADEDENAEDITTGAKNGLVLADLRGVDKDDEKWDQLLDELTIDELQDIIGLGGYQTAAAASIEKVRTNDCDGPASINNNFTGVGSVGFPAATLIGMTWSKDLAHDFGSSIGKMADEMDTSGWYAPAMNIHRTAFAGRNFEYYSEDGVLSGEMAAQAVQGAAEHGVYSYMKHFALNDQEGNRTSMLCTWSTEQAIREIYLKPFEISVKEGGCEAVMSSFNYIGSRWAGGCKELLNNVLRDEWGFDGFVETDYFGVYGYMTADQAVRNGTDLMLCTTGNDYNNVTVLTNGGKQAMRTAAKNILYVVANSRAYAEENLNSGMASWQKIMIGADVAVGVVIVLLEIAAIKAYKKNKKAEAQA